MSRTAIPKPLNERPLLPWLALFLIGLGWGMTGPFSKLAVSTGHHPIGVSFWDAAIAAAVTTAILLATGRRLPLNRAYLKFFLVCGFLGTALPNSLSYTAYRELPVGVVVILLSLVPMATLAVGLLAKVEWVDRRRLAGLCLGLVAVLMIVLPKSSLPSPEQAVWVALPVIVTLSYAGENVFIAMARPRGLDGLTILCGLCWGGMLLLVPPMLASGAWFDLSPMGPPEQAIVAIALLHVGAYFGFIWLIGRAGPVFAAQVGYIVTASGVILGMIFYGERHSLWIWGALVLMFAGLTLVKPKRREESETPLAEL